MVKIERIVEFSIKKLVIDDGIVVRQHREIQINGQLDKDKADLIIKTLQNTIGRNK